MMAVDLPVPDWVEQYVRCWLDRLDLNHWKLHLLLEQTVNDDPSTRAAVQIWLTRAMAEVKFRADIEDTADWQRTIIHEILHIKHEPIDQLIRESIVPELEGPAGRIAA